MKIKDIFDKFFIACFFILYFYYEVYKMYPKQPLVDFPFVFCVFFFCILASYSIFKNLPWDDLFFRVFLLFELLVYSTMMGNSFCEGIFVGQQIITYLFPLFAYLFMFNFTLSQKNVNLVPYVMLGITLLFIFIVFTNENNSLLDDIISVDSATYTALYLLPFILCVKSKVFRCIGIIAVNVAVALGFKRGGLICSFLGTYTYFIVSSVYAMSLFTKIKRIAFTLGSVVLAGALLYFINESMDDYIFHRFSLIEKGGGSGRDKILLNTLDMIQNSSIWSWLVGHGYNTVLRDATFFSNLKYSAHNDFLECFYDFGLFSFVAYILLYVSLVKKNLALTKKNSFYAAPLAASVMMFLANSLVSHIFFYEWHFLSLALFWGFVHAACKKENGGDGCS